MNNFKKIAITVMAIAIAMLVSSCGLIPGGDPAPEEHVHELSEVAEVAATCTKAGVKAYYTCSGCDKLFADAEGATEIEAPEAIAALGHTEETVAGSAATCTATGLTEGKKCSVCGETTLAQEAIEALGHTEEAVAGKAATCTEAGITEGKKCSVCGETTLAQEAIAALGHSEKAVAGKAATCTETGLTMGLKCSVCGEITLAQEAIAAKGHSFTNYVSDNNATCTEDGTKTAVCVNDDCYETDTLADAGSKKGHTPAGAVKENVVNASCSTDGSYDSVVYCTVDSCKHEIGREKVTVKATGEHVYATLQEKVEATCTVDGYEIMACGCGATQRTGFVAPGHSYEATVIAPTCTEAGYTVHACACGDSYNTDDVAALGHDFSGDVIESDGNYYKECQNGCGTTQQEEIPVTSYDATLDNEFVSDKENTLNLVFAPYGVWGISTNGSHKVEVDNGSPESGAIGGLDAAGKYVYYEFVMSEAGVVDFIWNIAGSNYNASTKANDGLADMANHMTVTIDGIPIDVSGIALSAEGDYPWWNLQNVIVKGVKLEAGVHTFKCDITAAGGLNIGSMTVKSTAEASVRSADITSVSVSTEGEKVYYVFTMKQNGYTAEDIKFWHNTTTYYDVASFETVDGVTTVKVDVTDLAVGTVIDPHMSFGIFNYINNANKNGDVRGDGIVYNEGYIKVNDKCYIILTNYSMPSLRVAGSNYMSIQGADIYRENDKIYYTLTYRIAEYDPASFEFFDGSTIYAVESYEVNGTLVTFKINVTDLSSLWPHLRVNGTNWDGAKNASSSNGDVKVGVTQENAYLGGKTYTLKAQYSMPTVVVTERVLAAEVDKNYESSKTLIGEYVYGSEGVETNGSSTNEYAGGIGGMDKLNKYVTYTFTTTADGVVDFVWDIAGSAWNGSGNSGLDDAGNHISVTIDGQTVNFAGIALPAGTGSATSIWWNVQQIVIKDLDLAAGTHTFTCTILQDGSGLNVGAMNIYFAAN